MSKVGSTIEGSSQKGRIWFGVLVVLSIILIGLGRTDVGAKIQVSISSLFSPFSTLASFLFNEFKIRHENKVLKLKLAEFSMKNQAFQSLRGENDRLRELLEFKSRETSKLIAARVVGRDPGPITGTCIIDKGAVDGIRRGLPVITVEGVYGKVIETTERGALIETIFNFNFRVAVIDLRTGIQGVVKWDGSRASLIAQVPVNSDIEVGDEIVASEIGSVFPKGLKVGKVKDVKVDETKLFCDAALEPACKFSKVEDVFVITEFVSAETTSSETPGWKIYKKIEVFPPEFSIPEPTIRTPE